VSPGVSTREAYDLCEAITRTQAANFYYGIRLLPRERRRAMCAAYAFARRVDDIGDGGLDPGEKLRLLDEAAGALAELERDGSSAAGSADPVIVALADAHARFSLPDGALGELIEGVRMDVNGVSYERFEDLVVYCRRVAGAIGRVCLAIFGTRQSREDGASAGATRERASALADDLGVALQLTNILRDVDEDAGIGRLYLPLEGLLHAGITSTDPQKVISDPALPKVCAPLAARARAHFAKADEVMDRNSRRTVRAPRIMSKYYRAILDLLLARGFAAPREPVRVHKWAKIAILLRYAII